MTSIMEEVRRDAISQLTQHSLTPKEQRALYLAVTEVCILSNIGRKEGLLALEEAGNNLPGDIPCIPYLQKAVLAVVDGCAPEWIEELLTTIYWVEKKEPIDAVIYYIYLRGLLMIQSGENPRMIEAILSAFIPSECREEFEEYKEERISELKRKEEDRNTYLYNKIQLIPQSEDLREHASRLAQTFWGLDDRCIQRVLREVNTCELSDAMTCLPKNVNKKLFDNMSYRLQKMMMGDIVNKIYYSNDTYQTNEWNALKSIQKILYVIERLEYEGAIIMIGGTE